MKNIFDLYTAGIVDDSLYEENATPANTMGIGNPMPATENTPGSEPLVPAKKCKKAKCKKEKIDEASILDIEGAIKSGDEYTKVMNEIQKELKVLQSMKWNEDWTTTIGEHQYEWYCPKFIEHYLGIKAHSILFTINLYNSGREHDCDTKMFIYDKTKDYYSIACRDFLCNSKIYSTETKMIKAIVDEIKDKFKESNLSRTLVRLKDLIKLEKFEKVNEASILGDIEDTLKTGDDIANAILDLANHLADCAKQYENISYTEDEILELSMNAVNNKILSTGRPGEIIYDFKGFDSIKDKKTLIFVREFFYNYGTLMIDSKKFPKSVKKLTLKNFKRECTIDLYGDNDISNLDITVEGGSALIIKTKESTNIVKLGKIVCSEFIMSDDIIKNVKSTGVSFKTGSSIEIIDLRNCMCIESITGSNLGTTYFTFNKNIIRHNLIKLGLADQKARIILE